MNTLTQHGQWISEFGFYLLLALNIVTFVKLFLPQKREVRLTDAAATRAELDALDARLSRLEEWFENLRDAIQQERESLLVAGEDRMQRLQQHIDALRAEMKHDREQALAQREDTAIRLHQRINELVDGVHARVEQLSRRIEEMPVTLFRLTQKQP